MAARRLYVLEDDRRVILQGSRQASSNFKTGPSLFQNRKRKSSDPVCCSEPKKLCCRTSTDGFGGDTLQGAPRTDGHTEGTIEGRSPVIAPSLDQPSKTRKRKATDAGDEIKPKKFQPESTTSNSEHESLEKRRKKEEKRLRKALKRVATARVSDLETTYEEQEELGEGAFGSVFSGVRISDQQPVAIKHIKREDVDFVPVTIKKEVYSVPEEVVLMTKAAPDCHSVGKNPSVNLLHWYLQGQEVVLVMERPTPSEDLFNYCLKNAPMPEDQAKVLMRQVVDALVDLHSKGVFHRDIKMENLLVQTTESGPRIRIIDFGCSCNVQSEPYCDYNGTEEFAPPEAFKNKGYHAGPTSVWQIGALLYELLRPDENEEFTTKRWIKGKLSVSGVSQECSHFLQVCLAVNPTYRISLDQLRHHPWFSVV